MSSTEDGRTSSMLAVRLANNKASGLRLLALDGGGIRGLSELCILDQLMTKLHKEMGLPSTEALRPCDVFQMIAGTSTGGLVAIMLGRLRMTVRQCIDAYSKFAETVFSDPVSKFSFQDGRFKASKLERAIKDIVKDQAQGELMLDSRPDACKVFVCAVAAASVNHARRLRTYDESSIGNCTISDAARATSAAPTFFEPAEITIHGVKERFIDGALGFNNPVWELFAEARAVFPDKPIDCLLSIGTGSTVRGILRRPRLLETKIPKNVIDTLKHVAVNCQQSHERMLQQFETQPDVYFRFSVEAGLEAIGLQEWRKLSEVQSVTIDYLNGFEVQKRIITASSLLHHSLINEEGKSSAKPKLLYRGQLPFKTADNTRGNSKHSHDRSANGSSGPQQLSMTSASSRFPSRMQDERNPEDDILEDRMHLVTFMNKLKVDTSSLYNIRESKATRHQGTCEWINEKEEFKKWYCGQDLQILIVVAPPGYGKSTLAKYILEDIRRCHKVAPNNAVVEYFCHDTLGHDTALAVTQSLLYQMLENHEGSFHAVKERHARLLARKSELNLYELWEILVTAMRKSGLDNVFCVIDGLDECEDASQESLWNAIEKHLIDFPLPDRPSASSIHILFTSRPTALAKRIGLWTKELDIRRSDVDPDISRYINYRVDRMIRARLLPTDASNFTKEFLSESAEGMFLWADLSLNQLEDGEDIISYHTLPHILEEVPRDVKGLYARAIERIQENEASFLRARSIFGILLFALEHFSIQGLALALVEWPDSCTMHAEALLHCDLRLEYTAKRVCGPLIKISDGMVELCHHSARQFLREDAPELGFMVCDPEDGHARLAQICLRYLLLEDVELPRPGFTPDLKKYPLLSYALSNWPLHMSRSGEAIHQYGDLLRRFFDVSNVDRLKACLCWSPWFEEVFTCSEAVGAEIVIHALAFHGISNVLKVVGFVTQPGENTSSCQPLIQLDVPVDAKDPLGNTGLMCAAESGSLECAQIFLHNGADVNSCGQGGYTALHLAVMNSESDMVRLLIPLVDNVDSVSEDGSTPLLHAVTLDVIEALLNANANIEARDSHGTTLLTFAAGRLGAEIVEVLLSKGASTDTTNEQGWTPLLAAARAGAAPVVHTLLEHGASVTASLPSGSNALHQAACSGSADCVELLIRYGVDANSETLDGTTPLLTAAMYAQEAVARLLLKSGVDPGRSASSRNACATYVASLHGHTSLVRLLLEGGGNPAIPWVCGDTPLHAAAVAGHDEILACLVNHDAPVDIANESNQTPLMLATLMRRYKCMEILMNAGADPTVTDEYGISALDSAANCAAAQSKMAGWEAHHAPRPLQERANIQRNYVRNQLLHFQKSMAEGHLDVRVTDHTIRGLLFLGEHTLAQTLVLLAARHNEEFYLICNMCERVLFYQVEQFQICKTCTWDLCETCVARYDEGRSSDDRLCQGHEMLVISETNWHELEPKNDTGAEKEHIVLQRWLAEMRREFDIHEDGGADNEATSDHGRHDSTMA